jgi:hypothetical protein
MKKMIEKRKRRMIEAAQPELEPGEQVREVMIGQTFISPLAYLIVGQLLFVFMVRPRIAMVTDSNVYMFEGNMWRPNKLNRLIEKHPVGGAPIKLTKYSITIGNEKSYAMLWQFKSMKQVAALAQGGAAPEALQPAATTG